MADQNNKRKIAIWSIITILASSSLIYGLYIGFDAMLRQEEFKIKKKKISFTLPDWISEQGKEKINDLLLSENSKSLFDKNLSEDITNTYKQTPIIKSVVSVKREFPNKINVLFKLRKPIAAVISRGDVFLVDDSGVRLPGKYYNWPINNEHSVYIMSDKLKEIPSIGKRWSDKRILAGVDLVKFLKRNKADKILNIEKIDVSNVGMRFLTRKSDIVLWTKNGTEIKWGCPPLCGEVDELSDVEKLKNLFSVARVAGKDFGNMKYVDVRWTKPVGKRMD